MIFCEGSYNIVPKDVLGSGKLLSVAKIESINPELEREARQVLCNYDLSLNFSIYLYFYFSCNIMSRNIEKGSF